MKSNKSITKCLNDHYKLGNKDISIIEKKVLHVFGTMRKQYQVEHCKDKDSLLLLAALEKVGLDNIKKTCSK